MLTGWTLITTAALSRAKTAWRSPRGRARRAAESLNPAPRGESVAPYAQIAAENPRVKRERLTDQGLKMDIRRRSEGRR